MADLARILSAHRDDIAARLLTRLQRVGREGLADAFRPHAAALVDALAASQNNGRGDTLRAWARQIRGDALRSGFDYCEVLAALGCVPQTVRGLLASEVRGKRPFLETLASLDRTVDLARQACEEVFWPEGHRSDRHLRPMAALAETSADFVCITSLHGKPYFVNQAGRRMVGLSDTEPVGALALRDFYAEASWRELRDVAVPCVNDVGCWEGASQLQRRHSEKPIDVNTSMFVVRNTQPGGTPFLVIVHRDPAGAHRFEESLRESEVRKRAIIESALDPIVTIDHEGRITEFNRAAEQTFGLKRDEVLGKQPSDILFPSAKSADHQDRVDRYLSCGDGSMIGQRVEVTAIRASGELFPAEMAMTMGHERGQPVLTFFLRDISLRKQAEEEQARHAAELERWNEELARSNAELQQFAYVASHDLQEPLRKVRTFGERLEARIAEQLDDTCREYLRRMESAAERMQALINSLLVLSRVTTEGQSFVPVDPAKIAREVVNDLEVQIEQTEARVEIGKIPSIRADPVQMRQVFQNLIGNALKFRRPDVPPVIKIYGRFLKGRAEREAHEAPEEVRCRIVVEDNGIGLEQQYRERIFGVFQRLHTREAYEGTGIGLAICRKIVERHGGTIAVESTPGQGSRFEIVLPVTRRTKDKD